MLPMGSGTGFGDSSREPTRSNKIERKQNRAELEPFASPRPGNTRRPRAQCDISVSGGAREAQLSPAELRTREVQGESGGSTYRIGWFSKVEFHRVCASCVADMRCAA